MAIALRRVLVPGPASPDRHSASTLSVDVWYVDLDGDPAALSRFQSCLSEDELARATRFRSELRRSRFVVSRAALRHVLAARLGCSAAAVKLSTGAYGKPILENGQGRLGFSLSHSGGDAVIALADRAIVGVDYERARRIEDIGSISRLVFSDAERLELDHAHAPERVSAFLNGWTRKEAYLKALGLGFSAPVRKITVSLLGRAALLATGLPDQAASAWRLFNVPHPRGVVAVALRPAA